MKEYYEVDEDLAEAWKVSKELWSVDITPYLRLFYPRRIHV